MESNISNTIFTSPNSIFGVTEISSVPLKALFKLIVNSVLGGLLIFIINLIGSAWGFHIGVNVVTAVLVGILGIPGAILLIILKLFI